MFLRKLTDRFVQGLLFLAAFSSIGITVGIVAVLLLEGYHFFAQVGLWTFLTGREWSPLFSQPQFGILPLLSGTLVTTFVALLISVPLGTCAALYLSEYASHRFREIVKPFLELLSSVPTVIYGYFALLFVTPILQKVFMFLGLELPASNMFSAGFVMGIMILPYVSSISEDAMRAVPMHIREGSYAMGATKRQTAWRVVYPGAFSGIASAYVLAFSRAIGETMIVTIAAGMQADFTFNPFHPSQTMTAYIVQVSMGDLPHGGIGYQSIFAVGLTLFFMTLLFNILGYWLKKKFREAY